MPLDMPARHMRLCIGTDSAPNSGSGWGQAIAMPSIYKYQEPESSEIHGKDM